MLHAINFSRVLVGPFFFTYMYTFAQIEMYCHSYLFLFTIILIEGGIIIRYLVQRFMVNELMVFAKSN